MRIRRLGWAGIELTSAETTVATDMIASFGPMERFVAEPREPLPPPSGPVDTRVAAPSAELACLAGPGSERFAAPVLTPTRCRPYGSLAFSPRSGGAAASSGAGAPSQIIHDLDLGEADMRVLVAGATGAIGAQLVPQLVAARHLVAGMTRSARKSARLRALGAEPIVCDVFDAAALTDEVAGFAPDAVIHELTDLPQDSAQIPASAAANDRIRREGTRNLIAAAQAAGTGRFLAQSVAFALPGDSGAAVAEHEHAVLDANGVVLRYGHFYGPGTYHEHGRAPAPAVHVEEAARRTVEALDAPSGTITVVEAA